MKIQFDTPPSSAQEANGLSVRYAAAKRRVPRWRWYLLLTLVLVPPAYFLARFAASYRWQTAPAIVVTEQVVVRAQHPGRVEHAVPAGEQVAAGHPLMELREPARNDPDGALQMPLPLPMQMQTPAQTAAVARQAASQAQAATLSLRQSMLDEALRQRIMPNTTLSGRANLLVMPNLDAANIGYNLIRVATGGVAIGPILMGLDQPAHILTPASSSRRVVNMTAIVAVEAQIRAAMTTAASGK